MVCIWDIHEKASGGLASAFYYVYSFRQDLSIVDDDLEPKGGIDIRPDVILHFCFSISIATAFHLT